MNNITICAKYKGDSTTERGFRTMLFEIPPTGGKQPVPVPISLVPSFASQDTCIAGRYTEGTNIIINGRLYPHEDGKLYVVPTQPLEELKKIINLNQVNIAGEVEYISEQVSQDTFNFGIVVNAPPQKVLGHYKQDSLLFKCESSGDEAEMFKKFLHKGRAMSLGGRLKLDTFIDKNGTRRSHFKVRMRSLQYSFFEKQINKELSK